MLRSTAPAFGSTLLLLSLLACTSDKEDEGGGDQSGDVNDSPDTNEEDGEGGLGDGGDDEGGDSGGDGSGDSGDDGSGDDGSGDDGSGDDGSGGDGSTGSAASVYPSAPTVADDLQCLYGTELATAAGYSVAWTRNGLAQPELADADVDALYTVSGDDWACSVDTGSDLSESPAVTVDACNGALQFLVGDTLSAPPSGTFVRNEPFTLEMWINLQDADEGVILTYGLNNWYGIELSYDSGFVLTYKYGIYNTDWTTWTTGVQAHASGWHHIALVFDYPDWRLYKDGSYAAGTTSPEGNQLEGAYGLEVTLDNAFLDELHVSHQTRYGSNFTPAYPLAEDADTVLLLHLDEGTGATVRDAGPLGHDGTTSAFRSPSSAGCP